MLRCTKKAHCQRADCRERLRPCHSSRGVPRVRLPEKQSMRREAVSFQIIHSVAYYANIVAQKSIGCYQGELGKSSIFESSLQASETSAGTVMSNHIRGTARDPVRPVAESRITMTSLVAPVT